MIGAESSQALARQCEEQRERCLYTSSSLFIWLRFLRKARIAFVIVPIIFGSIAGWDLLQGHDGTFTTVTAVFAFLAGLVPAVYAALKLDDHLPTAAQLAGEYKNLEILFGDLRQTGPFKAFENFESEYKQARDRLEKANAQAYTAPEWCFRAAKKKIDAEHYSFENGKRGDTEVAPTSK
jgi:hypothetical protein